MGRLRVIGGTAKGRRLKSVPGKSTRPITDRAKESLFNILGTDVSGSKFMDLFAGTGSVGIEALSRGANFVRFVENNHLAQKTIKANLDSTGFSIQAEIVQQSVFKYLHKTPDIAFDYIYVAPPQYKQMWEKTLSILDTQNKWLASDGWIIVQIHPIEYIHNEYHSFKEFEQRKYGSTLFVFYAKYEIIPEVHFENENTKK